MSKKQFISPHRGRMIEVRVDETTGWITFHFSQEQDREFYSIPISEWISDRTNRLDRPDNWHNHMADKNWFSEQMKKFIDDNTKTLTNQ